LSINLLPKLWKSQFSFIKDSFVNWR